MDSGEGHLIITGDAEFTSDVVLEIPEGGCILFNSTTSSFIVGMENHGNLTVERGTVVSTGALSSDGSVLVAALGALELNTAAPSQISGNGLVIVSGGMLSASEGAVSFLGEVLGFSGIAGSNGAAFNFGAGSGLEECPIGLSNCLIIGAIAQDVATFCSFDSVVQRMQSSATAEQPFCEHECGQAVAMLPVCRDFILEHGQTGFKVRNSCADTNEVECDLKELVDAYVTSAPLEAFVQACVDVSALMAC